MEPWIIATLLAAAVQTLRFTLQKRLTVLGLSVGGATFSRFFFAAPLAGIGVIVTLFVFDQGAPGLGPWFWPFALSGGIAQITATFCTVALFKERSFAVGIAFAKTETVQVALFSALFLGETVSALGFGAIMLGMVGVIFLSRPPQGWRVGRFWNRATALGLTAGALFGVSAVGYRGAILQVDDPSAFVRALLTLFLVTSFQTLAMGAWLRLRDPGEITRVLGAWRATVAVGVTGVLGSLGWFVAFALQHAAYVMALGKIELLFALIVSMRYFHERPRASELAGLALLAVSLVVLVRAA